MSCVRLSTRRRPSNPLGQLRPAARLPPEVSSRQLIVFALAGALLMTFAVGVVLQTDAVDAWRAPGEPVTVELPLSLP